MGPGPGLPPPHHKQITNQHILHLKLMPGGRRRPAGGMNAQFHINCSGQVQSTARGATKEVHITLQNKRNQISHPKSFTLHHLLTFLPLPPASPAISGGSCCSSLDTPLSPVIGLSISIAAVISST